MLTFRFDAQQEKWGSVVKDGQTIELSSTTFLPYDLTMGGLMGCFTSTIWDQWEALGKSVIPLTMEANWVKRDTIPTTLQHVDLYLHMDSEDPTLIEGIKKAAYACSMMEMVSKVATIAVYLNDALLLDR